MSDDDALDRLDYYTLLGVSQDVSPEDVRKAFRTFARRYHPDRFIGQGEEKIARATRIYRRGSEAVQTLADLDARRAYDEALGRGDLRLRTDARPQARAPEPVPGRPRVEPLRSPSARAFFARAEGAARAGDLTTARRALLDALAQEPGHPLLEQALEKVEGHLRRGPA